MPEMNEVAHLLNRIGAHSPEDVAAALPAGATHNNYSLYVKNQDDLIGLVAYSLYKQHKINFFQSELTRTQQPATEEKIETFCALYGAPQQVELLRESAGKLLAQMNQALLNEAVTELNAQYQKQLVKELKEGNGLGKSVYFSLVGNIVTAAFIALAVWGASTNFDELLSKLKNAVAPTQTLTTPSGS